MTAGWPALAVVFLLACLLLPAGGDSARPWNDDGPQQQPSWCQNEECNCVPDGENRVTVKCEFSGEKDVVWESDKNLIKSLVALELNGDGRCNLTVNNKTLAAYAGLRSFKVTGFDRVMIKSQGVLAKNARMDFTVTISHVRQLYLDTNSFHPYDGTLDVLVEDCGVVRLGSEVVFKLRTFVFRRIDVLDLSKNTFKNAAESTAIEKMILEDLTAEKLPSHAFCTSIDMLAITNCKFGKIERRAFPIYIMNNVTLTNVTVNMVESEAFQNTTFITNLRMIRCNITEMQSDAIMSSVQSIIIEQSEFNSVRTSAVAVVNELTLSNNRFKQVASRGFMLHNLHTVLVHGNAFDQVEAEAFYESSAASPETKSVLRFSDNRFLNSAVSGRWVPTVRLQRAASETNIAGNTFGPCSCGPWRFVDATAAGGDNGGPADDNGDADFADRNYCKWNAKAAECANRTNTDGILIVEFAEAAKCDQDAGVAYDQCVRGTPFMSIIGNGNLGERGVITTVVLLVLCGFGALCAVSAVTWLNARGYFIKLRSLLTPNGRGGSGGSGGGTACRTMSAHSLSRMSVHEYAELQRVKLGGVGDVGAVRVIVYQDKGTQTVPEELTHEMLQNLRDKLDDPDDYAEARGIIEHLYDLIRVEETCCSSDWYTTRSGGSGGGLDDMTSTITTKAVIANGVEPRDVKSVGTGAPSLDRLRTPRIKAAGRAAPVVSADLLSRRPQLPPSPSPSVSDYVDPVDLLYGGAAGVRDDGSYADIYCELAELRTTAEDRPPPSPPQQPPPVPDKPTKV